MQKKDWRPEEFRKLVTLGESTTAGGWSTAPERCWPPRLAALINDFQAAPVELFNAGIGGNVISTRSPSYRVSGKPAALERLDKHVTAQRPDLLVVSYGLNDARGGTPLALFTEELHTLVQTVRARVRPLIVLLGPYYMTDFTVGGPDWSHADLALFHRFNDAVARVARDEECLYVDVLDANGETPWMVHHDGVHANDLGHMIIANRVFEVLAQHCSALARRTKEAERVSPRWRDESVLKADFGHDSGMRAS
jgi:lysophospholipase L1-like esterase